MMLITSSLTKMVSMQDLIIAQVASLLFRDFPDALLESWATVCLAQSLYTCYWSSWVV